MWRVEAFGIRKAHHHLGVLRMAPEPDPYASRLSIERVAKPEARRLAAVEKVQDRGLAEPLRPNSCHHRDGAADAAQHFQGLGNRFEVTMARAGPAQL